MIYAYVKTPEKRQQIEDLCRFIQEDFSSIGPKDLNTCVGTLIGVGIPGKHKGPAAVFAPQKTAPLMYAMPEILIFSALQDEKMDRFLAEYKKAGIQPIPLKAVATPYNVKWSLYELIVHLIDEHNIMKNM